MSDVTGPQPYSKPLHLFENIFLIKASVDDLHKKNKWTQPED